MNWEKTERKNKPKASVKVDQNVKGVKGHCKRHCEGTIHAECKRASDEFQINENYFAALLNNMESRIVNEYAATVTEKKAVINRIRKDDKTNYTSKMFD